MRCLVTNWIRKYELSVARFVPEDISINQNEISSTGLINNFTRQTAGAIVLTEHHFTTTITYTKSGTNGSVIIKIYNISEKSQESIRQNDRVILKAGYSTSSDLPIIFTGDITTVFTAFENRGKDSVTTIVCKDSQNIISNLRVSGSVAPKTTYKTLIKSLVNTLGENGLPLGEFYEGLPDPRPVIYRPYTISRTLLASRRSQESDFEYLEPLLRTLPNGRVYEGNVLQELSKVLKEINYIYYIYLGKLYIQPDGSLYGHVKKKESFTLTDSLLKHPVKPLKNTAGVSITQGSKSGIKAVTFLDGRIRLPNIVKLDTSSSLKGSYEVETIKYYLDFEGAAWDTELTLKRLE